MNPNGWKALQLMVDNSSDNEDRYFTPLETHIDEDSLNLLSVAGVVERTHDINDGFRLKHKAGVELLKHKPN